MSARRLALASAPLWSLLLGGALLAGCKRNLSALPPPVPMGPAEITELSASLGALQQQAESVRRYQGFVRIRGKGPEGGFDGRIVIVFERPDHLRVELLGPFGSTRWSAVATESGITVVFPGPKQFVEEEDTAEIVGRLLGVRLGVHEVMALLSGTGAVLEGELLDAHRRGSIVTTSFQNGARLELGGDGQIARVQTSTYRVAYPTAWKERRRQIPDTIELDTDDLRVTLTAEDVDVNVAVDPEAFLVEIPDGAQRLRPADVDGEAVFVVTQQKQ